MPEVVETQTKRERYPTGAPGESARSGSATGLAGPFSDVLDQLGRADIGEELIDALLAALGDGQRGRALTEAIIITGNARDPERLRASYTENRAAIEDYLSHVDLRRIARRSDSVQRSANRNATTFLVGAGLSLFLTRFF